MKNTVETFLNSKNKSKLSLLTAYDYTMAKLIDKAGINGILVGDSLGMVIQGEENTLGVTIEDVIYHTKAVVKGAENALVIADMPFMSYNITVEESVRNAGRLIKETKAHCVKLEGGEYVEQTVKAIVDAQIPVMGHIGLTPQSINAFGGFKVQGKSVENAKQIIKDAIALERAGAFAIVLECIPEKIAKIITEKINIPTIGIGAGRYCDGQILVYQDMLGMSEFGVKFVKKYASIGDVVVESVEQYIKEVEAVHFPQEEHVFKMNSEILKQLIDEIEEL